MDSADEILRIFALMGLASPDERRRFEKLGASQVHDDSEPSYFFIGASGSSKVVQIETEDARLE